MSKTKFLIGLIAVIALASAGCSQKLPGSWTEIDTGTGDAFMSMCFISDNVGWLNGSTDRDYTPPDENANGNTNSNANKSAASNKNTNSSKPGQKTVDPLKANGGFEVLHTVDGGKTWAPIPGLFENKIRLVWFAGADTGWAITTDHNILNTVDGGKTWALQRKAGTVKLKLFGNKKEPETDQPEQIDHIRFIDKMHGWAWGGGEHSMYAEQPGTLVATVNGGKNWNLVPYPFEQKISSLFFLDALNGWASTTDGLYRSTDGGLNWNKIQTKLPEEAFNAMAFANDHNGIVVGRMGRMDRTSDGGRSWWKLVEIKDQFIMRDICFADANHGWAVGDNGSILYTPDAGQSWLTLDSPVTGKLLSVQFIGNRVGWAAGLDGSVVKFEPK
ncbi:MAG TPA: YCF48-related protein [Blastocatellia bacterium]